MLSVDTLKWYCINLEKDVERRSKAEKQFADAGLKVTFFNAVYGRTLTPRQIKQYTNVSTRFLGHLGTIGCAMSHVKLWQTAASLDLDYIAITEDDVEFSRNATAALDSYLEQASSTNFDILYLGHREFDPDAKLGIGWQAYRAIHPNFGQREQKQITANLWIPRIVFATHCYIVSRAGYTKLLESIEGKIAGHIDLQIQTVPGLLSLAAWPPIAFQDTSHTLTSMADAQFPHTLNYLLDYKVENSFSPAYILTCPVGQVRMYAGLKLFSTL